MRLNVLFKVADDYYMIAFMVSETVKVDDILEFLKHEDIHNKKSLEEALDKYITASQSENYVPYWVYEDIHAIDLRN